MAEKKRILILGGGYGGVWAGKKLEKHFRDRQDVEITLVDKRPFHTLMTELHEVAAWRAEPESVQVSFRKIFGAKSIECAVDRDREGRFRGQGRARTQSGLSLRLPPRRHGKPDRVFRNARGLGELLHALVLRRRDAHSPAPRDDLRPGRAGDRIIEVRRAAPDLRRRRRGLHGHRDGRRAARLPRSHVPQSITWIPAEARVVVVEALPSILPMLEEPLRAKAEAYLRKKRLRAHDRARRS